MPSPAPAPAVIQPRWRTIVRRVFARKPVGQVLQEGSKTEMKRNLGRLDLIGIGIGSIIGTGIFVLTGTAAANDAGPAVLISFIIAAVVAALSAFSYAELGSMVPISGSAYTYTYVSLGEFLAWVIGWDLILEHLVGSATVAVGWSAYLVRFFEDAFSVVLTPKTTQPPIVWDGTSLKFIINHGSYINIPAIFIALLLMTIHIFGVRYASWTINAIVVVKILVVLFFIFGATKHIDSNNYRPFLPERVGNSYGALGVFRGAQHVFFAYIGFDSVTTAAQEAKDPQRDLPYGIIVSLVICTVLYMGVAAVLCGIARYDTLKNQPAPLTFALALYPNTRWLRILIDIGAIAGLSSVMLVSFLAQPRIFFIMSRDGLLPRIFGRLHPKFKTPYVPTLVTGTLCAIFAGVLPVDVLGDMTSVGTLLAFILVNISVVIMRFTHPHAERGFKTPFGPFLLPVPGAIIAILLIVLSDGPTIYRLFIWLAIGSLIYIGFGYRRSRVGNPDKWSPEDLAYFGDQGLFADATTEPSDSEFGGKKLEI
ncbi:amino acid transporter [Linderina pennispora]|uniref:Amino acid transporter n=1 Tax=Linderina pennispora TaxID=61395 RepID=A0A1Y1W3C6_9FUNG|nr:amino acid transporter [Linderina pennispora]ORX67978.1 amino acid transporter [Linderina pennispora]